MARSPRVDRPASRFTLDWMLVAVALFAAALVAGATIRTGSPDSDALRGASIAGLRSLADTERLILFEDYGFDEGGWNAQTVDRSRPELGGVLGPVSPGSEISREIDVPSGTDHVVLAFDILSWTTGSDVSVAVRIDDTVVLPNGTLDGLRMIVEGEDGGRQRIWLSLDAVSGPFRLSISTGPGAVPWALDNLTAVARLAED